MRESLLRVSTGDTKRRTRLSRKCVIVGVERLSQLHQMLRRMPEVEDPFGEREVHPQEFFQSTAAIGDRDLLLRFVPTDLRRLSAQLRPSSGSP